MTPAALLALMTVLAGLLAGVSWLAWRYFLMPPAPPVRPAPARLASSRLRGRAGRLAQPAFPLAVLCAALGIGAAGLLGRHMDFAPASLTSFAQGEHIRHALRPESLVPPPPLPPSVFVGTERPELAAADRDWNKLDPVFLRQVLVLLARLEARGYGFTLLEGWRSPERQESLAQAGPHVTQARAMQSRHQFGLAADLAPLRDGRVVISERDPWAWQAYQALGEEAEALGLTWGGRWNLRDYGHVEAPILSPRTGSS